MRNIVYNNNRNIHSVQNYKDIRALIVGGSGGVGESVSKELAKGGARLIVHGGRDKERFNKSVAVLRSYSSLVIPFWLPIKNTKKFLRAVRKWLPIDILIINYGPVMYKPIVDSTYQDWKDMAEKNFLLPAGLISTCFKYMQEQEYARIIVFGSDGSDGIRGYQTMAAYAAAKWALCSVMHSLQKQAPYPNFRCYALCPGYIADPSRDSTAQSADTHSIADTKQDTNTRSVAAITSVIMQLLKNKPSTIYDTIIGIDKIPKKLQYL